MKLAYQKVRHYPGGLEDWTRHRLPLERGAGPGSLSPAGPGSSTSAIGAPVAANLAGNAAVARPSILDGLRNLGDRSIRQLLFLWLWMILGFGAIYWLASFMRGSGLRQGSGPIMPNLDGFLTAIYFSFVTALSIGYGDVIPTGFFRLLAVAEGAAGLILFGMVISKLVSRRQEEITGEIHRITFENRLERVRTNLHLVLADIHEISLMCGDPGVRPERILARADSAVTVFAGELQAIHDLLYRPQLTPDEEALEAILAGLAMDLRELSEVLMCLPQSVPRSAALSSNLRSIRSLAHEICGECVPRAYAPELRELMDQIRDMAGRVA